ncbi:MAG: lipoyl(octanoyl) transferase LipB [Bacteroidales bacterium]|nr:lipoyl(octanoyl) transferase LipB [Bacteroidales bacterium]
MNKKVKFEDLKSIDYKEAWDYQKKLFNEIAEVKIANMKKPAEQIEETKNYLLFCEHPHVYTLGKHGSEKNLLVDAIQLQAKDATFYKIDRGGDITYHGPGQIVGYPIIDLNNFSLGIRDYIFNIEESIILTLKEYNINAERLKGATGVWLDTHDKSKTRKICAIGVKSSHWITMHGFAFNVNTNLDYFNYINPCGFVDKGVTSMQKEISKKIDFEEVKLKLKNNIARVFGMTLF